MRIIAIIVLSAALLFVGSCQQVQIRCLQEKCNGLLELQMTTTELQQQNVEIDRQQYKMINQILDNTGT